MKKVWKQITPVKLNNKQRELFAEYYSMAYKIAYSFNAPQISDDVKENIAFNALQRVVKAYDPGKDAKLSTFLHLCIMNNLKSEAKRLKRLPYQIAEVVDPLTSEHVSIFNLIAEKESVTENYDWDGFNDFLSRLKDKLSDRRKLLLDMMIDPQIHLEEFIKKHKPRKIPKRLSYAVMAKVVNRSIPRVALEIKAIREKAIQVLREQYND